MQSKTAASTADASVHSSFLRHAQFRWAKVAASLCGVSLLAYLWHDPAGGPSGDTWLGYTLGTIGALLILWLTWLGARKRSYRSTVGTLKGWTSAHVYLGISLMVVATLHCGFQFGWNVHTLAYVLMMGVILSGIYGIVVYARLPSMVTQLREGATREAWIHELFEINARAVDLADKISPEVHRKIVASCDNLRIGGSLREQLYGPRKAASYSESVKQDIEDRIGQLRTSKDILGFNPNQTAQGTVMYMAGQLAATGKQEKEAKRLQQLLDLIGRRNALTIRINRDIALHARLQVWLLVHVPLTFGLLAALIAHVISVFLYW